MRNLLIIFALLFFGISLSAQEETVSYIMNDGSVKTYNLNDIEDISMKNGQATYEMKIYLKNSAPVSYFSNQFYSMKYVRDSYNNFVYIVYSGVNQFSYLLANIDSVSYYHDSVVDPTNDMILIPAGTFQMGNTGEYRGEADRDVDYELPIHTVTISRAFYMSKYEVTQKQYEAVMGTNPSPNKGLNRPVDGVSWYDAVVFCNALSLQEGKTSCYTINGTNVACNWDANGYRLPTEAEWEYACKAGTNTDFYSGSLLDPNNDNLDKIGWYWGNSGIGAESVGQKQPNAFGLYDMSGNVLEWCWDWYSDYSSESLSDPTGPSSGKYRVIRGGGWHNYYPHYCRSSFRTDNVPKEVDNYAGFRIVRVGN